VITINLRYDFYWGHQVRIWCSDSVAIFRSAKTITLQGSDVISRAKDTSFMADKKKSRTGKTNCAAGDTSSIRFHAGHRVGKLMQGRTRPSIVRFVSREDRNLVWVKPGKIIP